MLRYREALNGHFGSLAEVERARGRPLAAAAATEKRRQVFPDHPLQQYNAAREFAFAASLLPRGAAERDRIADQAVATLRRAVECGFRDLPRLRTDPALDLLRQRPDFQEVLGLMTPVAQPPPGPK
jgi:hypothetical protein